MVDSPATVDYVVTAYTVDIVVVGAGEHGVRAAAALQEIGAGSTTEVIRGGVAVDVVALRRTVPLPGARIRGLVATFVGAAGIFGRAGAQGVTVALPVGRPRGGATVVSSKAEIITNTPTIETLLFTRILPPCTGGPTPSGRTVPLARPKHQ